jgi:hypothetical protein
LFLIKKKHLFLIPLLALGGRALGCFIGNTLMRLKGPNKANPNEKR